VCVFPGVAISCNRGRLLKQLTVDSSQRTRGFLVDQTHTYRCVCVFPGSHNVSLCTVHKLARGKT
jgi:hypothetical protein